MKNDINYIFKRVVIFFIIYLILTFFGLKNAHAMAYSDRFVNKVVEDKWLVGANSSITGAIHVTFSQSYNGEFNSTTYPNFYWVDICTSGYEPTLWITNGLSTIRPSTKWYKVDTPCYVGPNNEYQGNVYRQIMYLIDYVAISGASGVTSFEVDATGQLFSNTNYNTYMRFLRSGISYDAPIQDLLYDNNVTQLSVLNDILTELQNNNANQSLVNAVNNQTEEIKKQTEATKELNNTMKDSNISGANTEAQNMLNSVDATDNTGLSQVINMPLTLVNRLGSSCSPINLTIPYLDTNVSIPCMSTEVYSKFPSGIITTISIVVNGFLIYRIIASLYAMIKGFRSPDEDKVEVVDL